MHASRAQTVGFWIIALVTIMASSAAVITAWPSAMHYATNQSVILTSDASRANGGESLVDYQLATWLNPSNSLAYAGLAKAQLTNGQPDAALTSIMNAGTTPGLLPTKIRACVELGNYPAAASLVNQLLSDNSNDANLLLAMEALTLDGNTSQPQQLMARVSSSDALQAAQKVEAGNLPFAEELYTTDLPNASKSILLNLPISFERNVLLATIDENENTNASLSNAQTLLESAITMHPSDISARQLLIVVDRNENNLNGASQQASFVHRLQSGTP